MALSLPAYSSRSRAHPSLARVAPAFAARASSSLNKRSGYERRSSLVAVRAARTGGGGRHRRGLSSVTMSAAGWGRGRREQPWMVGSGAEAGGGFFLGGGGRPMVVGHR